MSLSQPSNPGLDRLERLVTTTSALIAETSLEGALDLSKAQYESLHDHRQLPGVDYQPQSEFVISRVGTAYETSFQDLGVEYYDYVP